LSYTIKVAQFEGPFDLILFFIERDELDIYDIPIHQLTSDFLTYIREMESVNIDLASEFIFVAASLMRVKAKMLLPRKELDEDGSEIDPRQELVQKLLEYKRYKETVNDFRTLAEVRTQWHIRGIAEEELLDITNSFENEMELESLNLFRLMKVFAKVVDKMEERERIQNLEHKVVRFPYTMEQEKGIVFSKLGLKDELHFEEIFEDCRDKIEAIFRFLGILELIQLKRLRIRLDDEFNDFWIRINMDLSEDEQKAIRELTENDLWSTDTGLEEEQ